MKLTLIVLTFALVGICTRTPKPLASLKPFSAPLSRPDTSPKAKEAKQPTDKALEPLQLAPRVPSINARVAAILNAQALQTEPLISGKLESLDEFAADATARAKRLRQLQALNVGDSGNALQTASMAYLDSQKEAMESYADFVQAATLSLAAIKLADENDLDKEALTLKIIPILGRAAKLLKTQFDQTIAAERQVKFAAAQAGAPFRPIFANHLGQTREILEKVGQVGSLVELLGG